ncbi:MAG: biotin--[acetyl-CoA-carboxylase] ligase [Bacteroidales bacterium]|nr:biotin--[acetyl-CoA-carboxylase] ligase [Bacteroidales bacterium]
MKTRIIGNKIISLLSVDSTNDYARSLLSKETPEEGTIIISGDQKQGRGYGDNVWHSKRGKNLLFSIILYPEFISANTQFLISKVICLGICDYLSSYISDVSIKWPNDIYVDDRKIAGILIENDLVGSSMKNSIVGIGINVNQEKFPADIPNPVSLNQMIEKKLVLKDELKNLSGFLEKRYQMLARGMDDKIRKDYHEKLFRLNEMSWYQNGAEKFKAKIIGVSDYGQLILENQSGKTLEYNFKEVEFVL